MPERTPRSTVYASIDSERAYQDAGQGNAERHPDQPKYMAPGEFILCMEKYLADARATWTTPEGGTKCLDSIRKVTALGVQCMELYGAPRREGF